MDTWNDRYHIRSAIFKARYYYIQYWGPFPKWITTKASRDFHICIHLWAEHSFEPILDLTVPIIIDRPPSLSIWRLVGKSIKRKHTTGHRSSRVLRNWHRKYIDRKIHVGQSSISASTSINTYGSQNNMAVCRLCSTLQLVPLFRFIVSEMSRSGLENGNLCGIAFIIKSVTQERSKQLLLGLVIRWSGLRFLWCKCHWFKSAFHGQSTHSTVFINSGPHTGLFLSPYRLCPNRDWNPG